MDTSGIEAVKDAEGNIQLFSCGDHGEDQEYIIHPVDGAFICRACVEAE